MVELQSGEVFRIERGTATTVTAHSGAVWVTEAANPRDYLLQAGESVRLCARGLVVVEALTEAAITCDS
jgi:hypothetical protein